MLMEGCKCLNSGFSFYRPLSHRSQSSFSCTLWQPATILKPWSSWSNLTYLKGIPLFVGVVPQVAPGSGQRQLHCDRSVCAQLLRRERGMKEIGTSICQMVMREQQQQEGCSFPTPGNHTCQHPLPQQLEWLPERAAQKDKALPLL